MAINYKVCPFCNSKDVAKIIYGYPSGDMIMSEATGKVKLGGCLINIEYSPDYHCNNCENQWDKEEAIYYAYEKIKKIKVSIGGYHQGHESLSIDLKTGEMTYSHSIDEEDNLSISLYPDVLEDFKDKLIGTNILNWKRNYDDNEILDGTQWEVELVRAKRNIKRSGSNHYPKEWEEFCKLISEISGRDFR